MTLTIDAYVTLGGDLTRDKLLAQMDRCGVDRAVIAPQDDELAVHNQAGNDRLLEAARISEGRLIAACTATPWRGDEALTLVGQAVDAGARLLVLSPATQGFNMTDERVSDLLTLAGQRRLPVYVHTGPHSMGGPTQTVLAAQQHADTKLLLGHCGATDHAWDMTVIASRHMGANLWLETSLARPWAVPGLLKAAGAQRVCFGSGAPLTDQAFELKQLREHVPPAAHDAVFGGNLAALLAEVN